jgi:cytochrome c-type biogenesis protein CcmH
MVFWFLAAVLVAAVTLAVTWPLTRSAPREEAAADVAAADLAVYKDQLKEVSTDEARGTLAAGEAESARSEIARRLLRTSAEMEKTDVREPATRNRLVSRVSLITSVALPAASLMLYLTYGTPGLPGEPLRERLAESVDTLKPNDLVAKVEARLRAHPDDGRGWDVLAPVYNAMGRYADAAAAYANALRLIGETPARLQGFADARIRAENGVIPEDARKALQRILVIDPTRKEPRIWLALAKEQDGRLDEAAADYRQLIADAPKDAPWRKVIEERLANLETGKSASSADVSVATPSTSKAKAVVAMSPEERQAFIGRMVDGLAARLKTDGSDAAGWVKLIRAYQVLGRKDDAVKALSDARSKLKGDEVGLAKVESLARELGLGS